MFDLEPTIMERFMFHDKPQCLGSDDIREGITTSTGIINLIHNHDVLDAFNFEPCGYSMNALADQSYYTIHISPEPDASYVSFETTAHVPSCPSFVAQVVKFFRPGKFTVSLIQHGKSARMTSLPSFNSLQVQKQLGFQYAVDEEANYDRTHLSPRFAVMAATFRSIERNNIGTLKMPTGHKMTYEEGLKIAEATARSHGAYFLGDNVSVEDVCTKYLSGKEAFQPTFVVNLTNLFHSFWSLQRIQQRNSSVHFRYSVNCNPDRAILAVLRDLEMDFEVANVDEIELLNELLVDRRRINLVQPILTAGLVSKFEMVGSVALFDIPPLPVQSALREANVDMEVCVNDFSFEETAQLLSHILNISENIKCISVETDYSSVKSLSDLQERLSDNLNQVERAVEDALGHNGEKVMFHIGGFDKVDVCGTRGDRKSIQSQTMQEMSCRKYSLSFDVSRFLVEDCASLVAQVIGRKCRKSPQSDLGEEVVCRNYYLRDGFYGSFSSIFMRQCHKGADRVKPKVLPRIPRTCEKERSEACGNPATDGTRQAQEPEYLSTLFGPTCDSMDHVWTGKLPALSVGDSILFPCMGAYSLSAMSQFNGFSRNVDVMHVLKQRGNQG